jgi:putative zinc finger/helix-turn-helix YgiT family protein
MTADWALEGHVHRGCGGHYKRRSENITIKVSGMAATVERSLFRCDSCGDDQYTVEQREAAEQAAVDSIRGYYELMTPKEIRRFRESTQLTPEQFGHLLWGTPRGVVEGWEKGRYLQNKQADELIRSLADPEVLKARAAKAGVVLPPPPELLALVGVGAAEPVVAAASEAGAEAAVAVAEPTVVEHEAAPDVASHDAHTEPTEP